jgi:hypothetical protein
LLLLGTVLPPLLLSGLGLLVGLTLVALYLPLINLLKMLF